MVLNGCEVGGGSIRIHDADLQTQVIESILKIPIQSMSHLIEALKSGCPPHGGIALGEKNQNKKFNHCKIAFNIIVLISQVLTDYYQFCVIQTAFVM